MQYLYGDSSISPFTSNFLEFLRDAIDFSVYLLLADARLTSTRERTDVRRIKAQAEVQEIEELGRTVNATIDATSKIMADSPASQCAARMTNLCDEAMRTAIEGVRAQLAADIAQAEAEEAAERQGCLKALLGLLEPHDPPESSTVRRLQLTDAGTYEAVLEGECSRLGLKWRRQLDVGDDHRFKQLVRVESVQRRLEVGAPELTGWIKKQVTVRRQHLERHVITDVVQKGSKLLLRLRTEVGKDEGFDIERDAETGRIAASRLIVGENQAAAGPFDVDAEDAPKIVELCEAVTAHLNELSSTRAFEVKLGDTDFQALPSFVDVVERLVGFLSPMVHEIARHSLEPDELVLRRQLADDRREEIFVSKITLRDKYEQLPLEHRRLFAPLGLHASLSRSMAPPPPTTMMETTRSELPPSNPPPPPARPIAPIAAPMPPLPTFALDLEPESAPIAPVSTTPIGAAPPKPAQPNRNSNPQVAPQPNRISNPQVAAQPSRNSNPQVAPQPSRAPNPQPQGKPEANMPPVRTVLEKIVALDSASRQPDAHRECATVLEGAAFASYDADDQRRVLQLLLVLESRATASEERLRALRAGRDRARGLVERLHDPVDYELLGLCQVALHESMAAAETFRAGLELATRKDSRSDLCGRFRRHVGALS